MQPLIAVFVVIASLSQAEVAYITRHLRAKKLLLFHEGLRKKNFKHEDFHSEFSQMPPKAFSILCAQLEARIAVLRGEYWQKNMPSEQIRMLRNQAAAFQGSGKHDKAKIAFQKAAVLAESLEEFEQAAKLIGSILLTMDDEAPHAQPFVEAQDRNIRCMHEVAQLIGLWQEVKHYKTLAEPERSDKATKMLERLIQLPRTQTVKGLVHYTRIKILCLALLLEVNKVYEILLETRGKVSGHNYLFHDPMAFQVLVAIHISLSTIQVGMGKADSAAQVLQEFASIVQEQGLVTPNLVLLETARVEVVVAWEQRDWTMFNSLTDALLTAMNKGKFPNPKRRIAVSVDLAKRYLLLGDAEKALVWVERINKDRKEKTIPEFFAAGAIMEMACLYMLEDWDGLGNAVRNAGYLFDTKDQANAYSTMVLKAFNDIGNKPNESKKVLRQLDLEIGKLIGNLDLKLLMEAFDLHGWITTMQQ